MSLKYFLARKRERMISLVGAISVIGVALGVASLIIVLSVMNGFDKEVKEKIIGTYAHITILKEGDISDYSNFISGMEANPGVKNASGFVTGQAILRKGNNAIGILLKGIDPVKESAVTKIIEYTKGLETGLNDDTIVLGSELMKDEGISIGDIIEVFVPHSMYDLEKNKLRVSGSFTSGRYDYDANMAVVNLQTSRKLFRMADSVTGVALSLENEMDSERFKRDLQRGLGNSFIVKSWMDLDRNLVAALALEKKMMFIILMLVVMVACFNVSSSLVMMVMEKTKDIGILKSIGANNFGISLVFLLVGGMIGLLGVALGTLSGIFIANRLNIVADFLEKLTGITVFPSDVYYFTEIPVEINSQDVGMIIVATFFLAIIAGLYPARKASRLDPVEAIRYE